MAKAPGKPPAMVAPRISSLEKKPPKNGMPARESAPTTKTMVACGIFRHSPPIWKMSLVATAWMTAPAPRKRRALKMPWVRRCRKPAEAKPAPMAARRDHGRGVDEGGDGRGALHGIGQPHVERELGRLAGRAQIDAEGDDAEALERDQPRVRELEELEEVEGARLVPEEHDAHE